MKKIGLTGGIGSGKSTASAYLKEKGIKIIDADELSRQMTAKDGPALPAIREAFGDEFFSSKGELDRKALGAVVFADAGQRQKLEQIVTKAVIERSKELLAEAEAEAESRCRAEAGGCEAARVGCGCGNEESRGDGASGDQNYSDLIILDAPLLFECGLQDYMDENWLVAADEDVVVARVMERDGLSEELARDRINSQMPLEDKKKIADKVIANDAGLEELYAQIDSLLDEKN